MHFVFTVFIDETISCPLAPDAAFSYRLNEAFYAHSSVTYKCVDGFWFPDHTLETDITCLTTGNWNKVVPACQGNCTHTSKHNNVHCIVFFCMVVICKWYITMI